MHSHISTVMAPRTERAFSRHDCMQLKIDEGWSGSQARNCATWSERMGRPVAWNAASVSVMTSGSLTVSGAARLLSEVDSKAND